MGDVLTQKRFTIGDVKLASFDDDVFAFRCNLYDAGACAAHISSSGAFSGFQYTWKCTAARDAFDLHLIEVGFDSRDTFIASLVCIYANAEWMRRVVKIKTVYKLQSDDPEVFRVYSHAFSEQVRIKVESMYSEPVQFFNDVFL